MTHRTQAQPYRNEPPLLQFPRLCGGEENHNQWPRNKSNEETPTLYKLQIENLHFVIEFPITLPVRFIFGVIHLVTLDGRKV